MFDESRGLSVALEKHFTACQATHDGPIICAASAAWRSAACPPPDYACRGHHSPGFGGRPMWTQSSRKELKQAEIKIDFPASPEIQLQRWRHCREADQAAMVDQIARRRDTAARHPSEATPALIRLSPPARIKTRPGAALTARPHHPPTVGVVTITASPASGTGLVAGFQRLDPAVGAAHLRRAHLAVAAAIDAFRRPDCGATTGSRIPSSRGSGWCAWCRRRRSTCPCRRSFRGCGNPRAAREAQLQHLRVGQARVGHVRVHADVPLKPRPSFMRPAGEPEQIVS